MVDSDVLTESADGRFIVRFVNGVGIPLEYRCASEAEARTLLEVLGMNGHGPRRRPGKHRPARAAGAYRVQVSDTAHGEIDGLPDAEWARLRRAIALAAINAADRAPPSRAMLLAAGVQPPVLRLREGAHVAVYEADSVDRSLTVLHVLQIG